MTPIMPLRFSADIRIRVKPPNYDQDRVRALARARGYWVSPPVIIRANTPVPLGLKQTAEELFHPQNAVTRGDQLYTEGLLDCCWISVGAKRRKTRGAHCIPYPNVMQAVKEALPLWTTLFRHTYPQQGLEGKIFGGRSYHSGSVQLKNCALETLEAERPKLNTSVLFGTPLHVEMDVFHKPQEDTWTIVLGTNSSPTQNQQQTGNNGPKALLDRKGKPIRNAATIHLDESTLGNFFDVIQIGPNDSLFLNKDTRPISRDKLDALANRDPMQW